MNAAKNISIVKTIRAVWVLAATVRLFWIALIGFPLSLWGSFLTHEPLYGFAYGFFGVILTSILFAAWKQLEKQKSDQPARREDFD